MRTQVMRALASVLVQSLEDFEVIVVDDGSTDRGACTVRDCGDPRVRLLEQPHRGSAAARNAGLGAARTSIVAFLDADDEWKPDFLDKTMGLLEKRASLVAVFSNIAVASTGMPLLRRVDQRDGIVENYFETLLANDAVGMTSSSTVVRREALQACGGFPEGVVTGEDFDTWARLAWSGPIGFVPDCLASYHLVSRDVETRGRELTPVPVVLNSFRDWSRAGRIPSQLLPATTRLLNRVLADHVSELAHRGRAEDARRVLREYWHGGGPWPAYAKAAVAARSPTRLLGWLRRIRRWRADTPL
jgi:glycosyltransferase involved in cell wall biosynthesis